MGTSFSWFFIFFEKWESVLKQWEPGGKLLKNPSKYSNATCIFLLVYILCFTLCNNYIIFNHIILIKYSIKYIADNDAQHRANQPHVR